MSIAALEAERELISERTSSPHRRYRESKHDIDHVTLHQRHGLDPSKSSTGVIWVTERAYEHGFLDHPDEWGNLGQGAPEVEDLPGQWPRPKTIPVPEHTLEYGPTAGIKPLREAVAHLYNTCHRQGKKIQYTWENVCIVPGGRAGLIRIAAVIDNSYMSYFIPDYSAYNEMMACFSGFSTVPGPLYEEDGYNLSAKKVKEEVKRGSGVILTSNPRNPTGRCVIGKELKEIQDICRMKATLIMDEFYAGFYYGGGCDGRTNSSAEFVEDVDEDDVLIIDGLTKRFRLPGWRIAWVIGPRVWIKAISSCGSYLDGGANVPFQEMAVNLLQPDTVRNEMRILQRHFKDKRDFVLKRLKEIGFDIGYVPDSTFYVWVNLSGLPKKIHHGLGFFEECLKEKVIIVPGIFFDLNPNSRRDLFDSPCHHFVRLSYGPKMELLIKGMDAIERVVNKHRSLDGNLAEAKTDH